MLNYDKNGQLSKSSTIDTRLNRWMADYHEELRTKTPLVFGAGGRLPEYGAYIDNLLLADVHTRMKASLKLDNEILRDLLMVHLIDKKKTYLLVENGGTCVFGDSWAQRFYARHNLASRVATTKMRDENPSDFEKKVWDYENILSLTLDTHKVPPALVVNMDETGCQLVPSATTTRAKKGQRKVCFKVDFW